MEYLNEVRMNCRIITSVVTNPYNVFFRVELIKTYKRPVKLKSGIMKYSSKLAVNCKAFPRTQADHTLMAIASKLNKGDEIFIRGELNNYAVNKEGVWTDNYYIKLFEVNTPRTLEELRKEEDIITRRIYPGGTAVSPVPPKDDARRFLSESIGEEDMPDDERTI
jgi:hypothetical protein